MKTNITIHNTTPTTIVSGFVRRNDRTGPMPSYVGCPQLMRLRGSGIACVKLGAAISVGAFGSGSEDLIVFPGTGDSQCLRREGVMAFVGCQKMGVMRFL